MPIRGEGEEKEERKEEEKEEGEASALPPASASIAFAREESIGADAQSQGLRHKFFYTLKLNISPS